MKPARLNPISDVTQIAPLAVVAASMPRLISQRAVSDVTGLHRVSIWRLELRGDFPKRRRLINGRVGWLESEVAEWIRSRTTELAGH